MQAQLMVREREYGFGGRLRVTARSIYRETTFTDAIAEAWFDQMGDDRGLRKDVAAELGKWRAAERALEARDGVRSRDVAECYLRVMRQRKGLPARSVRDLG